jgi:hypothetical protein
MKSKDKAVGFLWSVHTSLYVGAQRSNRRSPIGIVSKYMCATYEQSTAGPLKRQYGAVRAFAGVGRNVWHLGESAKSGAFPHGWVHLARFQGVAGFKIYQMVVKPDKRILLSLLRSGTPK